MPTKRAPQVKRAPLRALYTMKPLRNIWYDPQLGWRRRVLDGKQWLTYGVSERTALVALGYIQKRKRESTFVPHEVQAIPLPGTQIAKDDKE